MDMLIVARRCMVVGEPQLTLDRTEFQKHADGH